MNIRRQLTILFIYLGNILLTTQVALNAKLPSSSRYELTVGYATTKYKEERNFGSVIPEAQKQTGLDYAFTWQLFLIPPWFDMELKAEVTDSSQGTTESTGHQLKWRELTAKMGFTFPLLFERFGFRIAGEYFYLKNMDP